MQGSANPFNFKEPILPGTGFVHIWRQASLKKAADELRLAPHEVLEGLDIFGARRTGKSTFCLQLENYLKGEGFKNVVYIPAILLGGLDANSNLVNLVQSLANELTKMGFALQLQNLEDLDSNETSEAEVLNRFVSTVWDSVKSSQESFEAASPVVVILDGTEILSKDAWGGLVSAWRLLRHHYQQYGANHLMRMRLILSGFRDVWEVYRWQQGTPFNPFSRINLPSFTDEEVLDLVIRGFKLSANEDLYRFTKQMQARVSGHPWLVQKFCYFAFQKCGDDLATVDLEDIEKAVAEFPDPNLRDTLDFLKKNPDAMRLLKRATLSNVEMYDPHGHLTQIANWGVIDLKESHEFFINAYYRARLAEYLRQFQADERSTEAESDVSIDVRVRTLQRRERLEKLGLLQPSKIESNSMALSPNMVMSDLEGCIRESYALIREHWESIVDSLNPEAKHYSRRIIQSHWENIQDYLSQYMAICKRLGNPLPQDIVEIAAHFDEYAVLEQIAGSSQYMNTNHDTGDKVIKILFLTANPSHTTWLKLDSESRAIDQALRQSEFRDRFDIKQQWAVRVSDLQNCLLRHKPNIVHFSGHGGLSSEIILEDDLGNSCSVPVAALTRLFSVLKGTIRGVILNSCYSEQQATAIAEHIDFVIGMSGEINDSAAIKFAASFYQALGFGQDIKSAFDLGCIQLELENLPDQDTPKLIAIKSDPREIVLVAGG